VTSRSTGWAQPHPRRSGGCPAREGVVITGDCYSGRHLRRSAPVVSRLAASLDRLLDLHARDLCPPVTGRCTGRYPGDAPRAGIVAAPSIRQAPGQPRRGETLEQARKSLAPMSSVAGWPERTSPWASCSRATAADLPDGRIPRWSPIPARFCVGDAAADLDRVLRETSGRGRAGCRQRSPPCSPKRIVLSNGRHAARGRPPSRRNYASSGGPLALRARPMPPTVRSCYVVGLLLAGLASRYRKFVLALRRDPRGAVDRCRYRQQRAD